MLGFSPLSVAPLSDLGESPALQMTKVNRGVINLVNTTSPIDFSNPLNRGLISRLTVLPNSQYPVSKTFKDLNRATQNDAGLYTATVTPTNLDISRDREGGYGGIILTGSNDNITIDNPSRFPSYNSELTMCCWVKFYTFSVAEEIILSSGQSGFIENARSIHWNGLQFVVDSSDSSAIADNASAPPGYSSYTSPGEWFHIAGTWSSNRTGRCLYINGQLAAINTNTSGTFTGSVDQVRAGQDHDNTKPLDGEIDDIRIYDRKLSDSEILALYKDSATGSKKSLNWVTVNNPAQEDVITPNIWSTVKNPILTNSLVNTSQPIRWDAPTNKGLVAWWFQLPNSQWRANKALLDLCPKKNDATLMSSARVWAANGKPGGFRSIQFLGAADYLQAPTMIYGNSTSQGLTVSCWVRYSNGSDSLYHTIVGNRVSSRTNLGGFYLQPNQPSNVYGFDWHGDRISGVADSATGPTAIPTGWHMLTGTVGQGFVRVYLDGVLKGSVTRTNGFTTDTNTNTFIGCGYSSGPADFLNGFVDDVAIWDRELSESEILDRYNSSILGYPKELNWFRGTPVARFTPMDTIKSYAIGQNQPTIVNTTSPVNWAHPLNEGLLMRCQVLPQGVWAKGTIFRDLVRRFDGTLTADVAANVPTWTTASGREGGYGALLFGATNNPRIVGPNFSNTKTRFTISCWMKPAVLTRGDLVTSWNTGTGSTDNVFNLSYGNTSGKPQFDISNGATSSGSGVGSTVMSTGTWYHVLGKYDGTNAYVYLNGKLEASAAVSFSQAISPSPVMIGNNVALTGDFQGSIDDCRIWERALSDVEISELYETSQSLMDPTLNWFKVNYLQQTYIQPNTGTIYTEVGLGGISITGLNIASQYSNITSAGTLTFSGTSSLFTTAVLTGSGGISISGSSTVAELYTTITATGGIVIGGSGTVYSVNTPTPSGTITLGDSGTVTTISVVTSTGSVVISGTATVAELYANINASGSMTLGGVGLVAEIYAPTPSGTLTLSGTATAIETSVVTASGDISISGTGTVTTAAFTTGSGSIVISGSDTDIVKFNLTPSGTITLSGTSTVAVINSVTSTGNINIQGTGTVTTLAVITGTGTVTLSGNATDSISSTGIIGSGGISLSGTGTVTTIYNPTPSGTVTLSGTSTVAEIYTNINGSGGVLLTGSNPGTTIGNTTGSGSISLLGSDTDTIFYNTSSSGTLILSGTSTVAEIYTNITSTGSINITSTGIVYTQSNPTLSGGVIVGGSSTTNTLAVVTSSGTIQILGSSTVAEVYATILGSGTIVLDGTAPNNTGGSGEVGSGGISTSGSVIVNTVNNLVSTGTVTVNGTATVALLYTTIVASGTVSITGNITVSQVNTFTSSGQIALTGNATASQVNANYNPSGGLTVQGTTTIFTSSKPSISGGVFLSGSGTVNEIYTPSGTGTLNISGQGTSTSVNSISLSGNLQLTGIATVAELYTTITATGGINLTGNVTSSQVFSTITATGTLQTSGTSTLYQNNAITGLGGVLINGSIQDNQYSNLTATGSLTLQGNSTVNSSNSTTGQGNLTVSGSSTVAKIYANYQPLGGTSLSGNTSVYTTVNENSTGSVSILGNSLDIIAYGQIGSGGIVLSGSVFSYQLNVYQPSGGITLSGTSRVIYISAVVDNKGQIKYKNIKNLGGSELWIIQGRPTLNVKTDNHLDYLSKDIRKDQVDQRQNTQGSKKLDSRNISRRDINEK